MTHYSGISINKMMCQLITLYELVLVIVGCCCIIGDH